MKREIKFRGKSKETGEWLYGDLNHGLNNEIYIRHVVSGLFQKEAKVTMIDKDTDGQFTGLLDKNREEIYEGDIIEGRSYLYGYQLNPDGEQFDYKGIVEFQTQCDVGLCWVVSDGSGCWNLNKTVHRNEIDFCTGVIIGNIIDNPEFVNEAT